MRADAARNRERILEAARKLMAEQGADTEMTDIAREAGVGVGTLYRRFPDKDALITELVREKFLDAARADAGRRSASASSAPASGSTTTSARPARSRAATAASTRR